MSTKKHTIYVIQESTQGKPRTRGALHASPTANLHKEGGYRAARRDAAARELLEIGSALDT